MCWSWRWGPPTETACRCLAARNGARTRTRSRCGALPEPACAGCSWLGRAAATNWGEWRKSHQFSSSDMPRCAGEGCCGRRPEPATGLLLRQDEGEGLALGKLRLPCPAQRLAGCGLQLLRLLVAVQCCAAAAGMLQPLGVAATMPLPFQACAPCLALALTHAHWSPGRPLVQVMTVRGREYHPVYLWPATVSREVAFKDGFTLCIGHLPSVSPSVTKK